jgi:hypothetical protein
VGVLVEVGLAVEVGEGVTCVDVCVGEGVRLIVGVVVMVGEIVGTFGT